MYRNLYRPTCRKCGAKILRPRGYFKWSEEKVPEYCWKCGAEVTRRDLKQLKKCESTQRCYCLISSVLIIIIIIVLYFAYR